MRTHSLTHHHFRSLAISLVLSVQRARTALIPVESAGAALNSFLPPPDFLAERKGQAVFSYLSVDAEKHFLEKAERTGWLRLFSNVSLTPSSFPLSSFHRLRCSLGTFLLAHSLPGRGGVSCRKGRRYLYCGVSRHRLTITESPSTDREENISTRGSLYSLFSFFSSAFFRPLSVFLASLSSSVHISLGVCPLLYYSYHGRWRSVPLQRRTFLFSRPTATALFSPYGKSAVLSLRHFKALISRF